MATISKSQRNKPKLHFEGFSYVISKRNKFGSINWRCENRKCSGTITERDGKYNPGQKHSICTISAINVQRQVAMTIMKDRALTCFTESPALVLRHVKTSIQHEVSAAMGGESSLKRDIWRWRHEKFGKLNDPLTRQWIKIPNNLKYTQQGDEFVLYDSNDSDRILAFGTSKNLQILANCKTLIVDGTFDICPSQYSQLYVIHGITSTKFVYPLVFALLPNKKTSTYRKFFAAINSLVPLKPDNILMDLEKAALNAARDAFSGTNIMLCLFHFTQAIYRHIPPNLKKRMGENPEIEIMIKCLAALSFLPATHVADGFEILQTNHDIDMDQDVLGVFTYFKKTYIGDQYDPPLFSPELWNNHERVKLELPRTTNHAEAFNRKLSSKYLVSHPTIWRFIASMIDEQDNSERLMETRLSSANGPLKKIKYSSLDQNLQGLVNGYNHSTRNDDEVLKFLKGCAYNLSSIRKRGRLEASDDE